MLGSKFLTNIVNIETPVLIWISETQNKIESSRKRSRNHSELTLNSDAPTDHSEWDIDWKMKTSQL